MTDLLRAAPARGFVGSIEYRNRKRDGIEESGYRYKAQTSCRGKRREWDEKEEWRRRLVAAQQFEAILAGRIATRLRTPKVVCRSASITPVAAAQKTGWMSSMNAQLQQKRVILTLTLANGITNGPAVSFPGQNVLPAVFFFPVFLPP